MAQELLDSRPDAVMTMPNGYYAVDYGAIGLKMTTWEAWQKCGKAAVKLH